MRHGVKGRKLGRTASHKSALLNALTTSLLKYKRIKTTEAKAKGKADKKSKDGIEEATVVEEKSVKNSK